jgi:hypothetical protein
MTRITGITPAVVRVNDATDSESLRAPAGLTVGGGDRAGLTSRFLQYSHHMMITVTVIVPGPGHSPPASALTLRLTGRDDRRSIQVAEATGIVVVSAGIMSGPPRRLAGVSGDGPLTVPWAMGLRSRQHNFDGRLQPSHGV